MDVGFMDVALLERVMEDDTLRLKRRNVARTCATKRRAIRRSFTLRATAYLYDDEAGKLDQVIAAYRLRYTFEANDGLAPLAGWAQSDW
ncbi:MAG: hypothetical protein IPN38_20770 [Flavobacteriales bacterium]|nr:hypothetical protein [Flavobacteriales bacterium]